MSNLDNYEFLTQIARGFNPITGEVFPEDDVLRTPEVSSRLFKLACDLKEEEEELTAKIKMEFQYTPDINALIRVTESAKMKDLFSTIYKAIRQTTKIEAISGSEIKKKINAYLVEQGILENVETSSYRVKRYNVTEYGKELGFSVMLEPEKSEVDRMLVCCSGQAQELILSKLPEILN